MIWLLFAILTLIFLLLLSAPLLKDGKYSRGFISFFFAAFLGLSLGTYAFIGSPELLKDGALKPYEAPSGPSAEQMQAAQQMTPEERAEMILAMVDGLAARLKDNPQDEQGWIRLIRARTVLGQEDKLAADMARVKEVFKNDPEAITRILGETN